ncbi:S-adenosyl-L-methionine-dependent methyltransferase [Talaromyces proteolyticus]|uniref:S-adenosyl-L-methionine-dependent methyltransferase n=1 Tax=Talaromyces proteolyticus TaxID=1131652 RepID=A0AAD4KWS6_9EURO|nr:S-adenosyl-L-methionine-dependent methyltransferase [Talaromyces proteolyticus]KAH8701761.1 S-adenosyl-L-methionine-dependent methyltransferase [Talaromyces proteolyticus]
MPSNIQVFFPKESIPALYPNEKVGERVTTYAEKHTSTIPRHIIDYHDHIKMTQPKTANYMISISEAQALVFLARTVGAKRVLEIGSYVGLSMLAWSHAVGSQGHVTGLEFEPSFAQMAKEAFSANGAQNTELVVGDALETLQNLAPSEPYDIIFIDAQKTGYPNYLATILRLSQPAAATRLLRPGGLIIADNVLRCGFVADDSEDNPWRNYDFGPHRKEYWKSADVQSVKAYNQSIIESERVENWLCPLWDGVNMSRLLD